MEGSPKARSWPKTLANGSSCGLSGAKLNVQTCVMFTVLVDALGNWCLAYGSGRGVQD